MVGYGVKAAVASLAALLATGPAVAGGPGPRDCDCAPHPHARMVEQLVPVTYYETRKVYVPQRVYVQRRGYVRTQFYLVDQGPNFGVPAVPYTQPVIYQVGVRVSPAEAVRVKSAPHRRGYRKTHRRHMHGTHRHGAHRHGAHRHDGRHMHGHRGMRIATSPAPRGKGRAAPRRKAHH